MNVELFKEVDLASLDRIIGPDRNGPTGDSNRPPVQHPKPEIVFFRSNVVGNVLIEGEVLEFSWQVRNADHVRLFAATESFDVASTSHCHLRFYKAQEVKLVADNKYGQLAEAVLPVHVVPRPRYDRIVPTPVIVHEQFLQFSIPPISSIQPPSLSILDQASSFGGLLHISREMEAALTGPEIKETHSIN
ncbi:MAG: hypothetical protein RLZZ519_3137 [Bacteroidota bacterium]